MVTSVRESERLRKEITAGDTVYTVLRHHADSGMYRCLDVYVIRENKPLRITRWVADLCGLHWDKKHEAIGVKGVGLDVGLMVVDTLARSLFTAAEAEEFHGAQGTPAWRSHGADALLRHDWI